MSDRYIQLLQQFPPRTINNEAELEATQVVIDIKTSFVSGSIFEVVFCLQL